MKEGNFIIITIKRTKKEELEHRASLQFSTTRSLVGYESHKGVSMIYDLK